MQQAHLCRIFFFLFGNAQKNVKFLKCKSSSLIYNAQHTFLLKLGQFELHYSNKKWGFHRVIYNLMWCCISTHMGQNFMCSGSRWFNIFVNFLCMHNSKWFISYQRKNWFGYSKRFNEIKIFLSSIQPALNYHQKKFNVC